MTIYTAVQTDKKTEKDVFVPEIVTDSLTHSKDDGETENCVVTVKATRVNYFQHSKRSFCIHILLTVMVLVILACGTIGALVFYKHLNKKVYSGVCGNVFYDTIYHANTGQLSGGKLDSNYRDDNMDYIEERIEVSEVDLYEQLYTPQFDEVQENYVWHDFSKNYTAIIDHELHHCYVMKLNRTAIAPPKDLIDLVDKLMTGYYMPKAKVIRENYRVTYPPLSDLEPLGRRIFTKCSHYDTFWLEKLNDKVTKRSAENSFARIHAMLSNHIAEQEIYKMLIHGIRQNSKLEVDEKSAEKLKE